MGFVQVKNTGKVNIPPITRLELRSVEHIQTYLCPLCRLARKAAIKVHHFCLF